MADAFIDLPPGSFPLKVRLYRDRNEEPTWECDVSGPGALYVPAIGGITYATVEYADGRIDERVVDGTES